MEDQAEMPEPGSSRDEKAAAAKAKAKRMLAWAVGVPVALVLLFVALVPAGFLELRLSVLLKLAAGVIATIVLAAGLMAASFYSDASGMDDEAPEA
ncbi:MAG: hypothetical protein AAGH41_04085 [Pseudomonadota bacterium]